MRLKASVYICLLTTACFAWSGTALFAGDYTDPETGMEFVLIKGGSYIMGDIYGSDDYAKPAHTVAVEDFYLGKYEVTFDQYDQFCQATKCEAPDDEGFGRKNLPVMNITHAEAVAFTTWLSKSSGKAFRLPTEAEWEYAARSGKSTNFWWGNNIGTGNANCIGCGSDLDRKSTAPVGSFKPTPSGLYDIYGNVYEWVADSWHPNYVGAPVDGSVWVDKQAKESVSRGGSWLEIPSSLFNYSRNWSDAKEPRKDIGLRVVMEP